MDTASEAIHSILPIFLVHTLGASVVMLGLIEGVAEGFTAITKLGSGILSDKLQARKSLTIVGYSLAAVSKPLFAIATSVPMVIFARMSDRFGKGIRGAPRDALIADITPPELQGAAFGLRQGLDTVGAVAGPLGAMALMIWCGFDVRAVFWVAVIPATLAVFVLWLGVQEPADKTPQKDKRWSLRAALSLPPSFWAVIAIGAGLTMARFSEAFLILRAQEQGLSPALLPWVRVNMNVVLAMVSYPAGALADRVPPVWLLIASCVVLACAHALFVFAPSLPWIMAGVAIWGLHLGLSQGVMSAIVALAAPSHVRASAFGLFNLIMGLAIIASSVLAGLLWETLGSAATFTAGGVFSVLSLMGALMCAPLLRRG